MHHLFSALFVLTLLANPSSAGLQQGLSKAAAQALVAELFIERAAQLEYERSQELENECFAIGERRLRFRERVFGEQPKGGHSLWISLHGGGSGPSSMNDGQWRNQLDLYKPKEGIYVAPRAPGDTWDLWHQAHVDPLLERLIDSFVAARGVDPERVYLLGYSAGGDGVYQLAPRMADRFGAACMMAGHPNEARPLGLRNLPFGLFVGGKDAAYGRNNVALGWNTQLDALALQDPGAYVHLFRSYAECGHWMDGQDAEGLPWMARMTRNTWPGRVVWLQDDVLRQEFYWLQALPGQAAKGQLVRAEIRGQEIHLVSESVPGVVLRLRDELIDLDREISVFKEEQLVFKGLVPRSRAAIEDSLQTRCDRSWAAYAKLKITW